MRPDTDASPLIAAANPTAPTAATEHHNASDLPRPTKRRWHPLRSGLLNLYRYDEQEFWFEQGRLLLRGNNGTGKSRVLALQLPFLLDGEIAPHRVEPDRDPAKRMEWNLLMNRHSDRLGYTWIEFGRLLHDGSESFLTLGCGLRAVQGRGIDDRWFFITPQRIGADLFLMSEGRNPLSRERLEQAVGRERVYRQARDYRRAVDAALFKLGTRYEPLIELLIRLRQPQLSRQLDESALSRALSEALAPLPMGLIDETAEAFRGLEADRDDLAAVRITQAGVQEFLVEYRRYIRAAARRRAEAVRSANSAFEAAGRRLRDATHRRDEASAAGALLKRELNANEDSQVALQAAIRALEESPEMRGARELERSRQEAERCANARTQAERDAQVAFAAEQQAHHEHAEVCAKAENVARQSASALATAAQRAAGAAFAEPHAAAIATVGELDTASEQLNSVRRRLDAAVQQRLSAITHLSRLQADLSRATQAAAELERALNNAATELGEAREREQGARLALEVATEQVVADFVAWHAGLQQLAIADPDSLIEEFRVWAERAEGSGPFQDAAGAARQSADRAVTQEHTLVEMQARDQAARADEIAAEIERLESGVHVPPTPPHTRATGRADRPGAPLWQLCDFRSETSAAVRAGVEAALEASGLLDAWVYPDGVVVDPATQDTLLIVAPASGAPADGDVSARATLNVWLEPVAAVNQAGTVPVSSETVGWILDAIGATAGAGEHWVTDDGSWQLGPLRGNWSKSEAEHIGEASRAAARRRQAAALRQELALVNEERERLRELLEDLGARRATIAAEYEALPSDAGLRQAGFALVHAAATVVAGIDRLQKAEERSSAARLAVDRARQLRDVDAADTRLTAWVERLDDLREAFGSYREALSAVWPQLQRAADAQLQHQRSAARLAAAQAAHQERAARQRQAEIEAHEAGSRYRALHATVGASADAILLQHAATVQSLEETKRLGKSLAAQERERDLERERAAADIERHTADHLRHETERRDAVERLAAFSVRRLLAEADNAFATLDLSGEWSPTRGVDLARRAETVLADTPCDDEAWRRHQESIHQHITTLRDQLIPRGHQPEEHLLEDVVVVQCPFQGGLCTMTELGAILSDDLAARARLLDEKEREVIENHLLGEVVLELQKLVLEAEKWVGATNEQLSSRPTSTGMLLRFQWEPDPDGPDGLESVRRQLLRTRELWTPEERRGLAEFLQTRIREARDQNETGTWRDYLSAALDYRKWHRFAVERHQDGQWRRLTRRTYGTGSGGEKALALTLPQFAAAAAHYQSADPAAPRLILLDEVFVGIDSEMRANCMGLLESFDLDFIMTSEREWGCYPTLSGLGIYQLSSRAGIDAVACTRWVWNGHQMQRPAAPPVRSVPPSRRPADSLSLPFDAPAA